jgi:cystathionine gamma-synthase
MHEETLAVHAGRFVDPATGAVALPLYLSTTFERDPNGGFSRGYSYIREANPNRNALEVCLRELEGGTEAIALASGMAAAFAVMQTLQPGERVVVSHDVYYGVCDLVVDYFSRWGIEHAFVDARDAGALRAACTAETKLVWIETPSNPLIEIIDIAACAEVAHAAGARLVVENTFASPIVQRPFEHGADVIIHSLTKYLAGHSDVMGGAVIVKDDAPFAREVRTAQKLCGAVLSPFDAFLTMRGIETLPARIRVHNENALAIARFLAKHPGVKRVHYPGLLDDPGHAVASKQMRGFGGMVSFEVCGGRTEAFAVATRLQLIARATSLGGTHSLIEHRASIEGPLSRAPESLLRLSVGIENADDLVADLDQALAGANPHNSSSA